MRLLLSFLFICIWQVSFSQMTFSEMKNIQKMDLNKFETYCLSRGFEFDETIDDEYNFGMSYVKGNGSSTKFLTFYEVFFIEEKNVVQYQTSSSSEYLSFKSQIEGAGLKLTNTFTKNERLFKEYNDLNYEVILVTGKSSDPNIDFYEIQLKRKKLN